MHDGSRPANPVRRAGPALWLRAAMVPVGAINVADSLAAIKQLSSTRRNLP